MNDERSAFALSCRDGAGPAPVLTGVHAEGRLDAVLFELTLRQTYRNTSDRLLEVVYTFPLPPMAVLLGFASELNGLRQGGVVVARHEAERRYEQALGDGDAPVMLEATGGGLHTANIGNLKPGDEIVLECRFAQLLAFEQGRLRVSIPTTVAPRFGDPGRAGLQPQQVPLASLEADHPLALALTIGPALASAALECPTHAVARSRGADGSIRLELAPGARLDRDVVVLVTPREPRPSLVVRGHDAADPATPQVRMAALQPPPGAPRARIALKLLVDCSGSMNGDSIASTRAALHGVVDGLTEADSLSLSRFGSTPEHLFAPVPATPSSLKTLRALVDRLQADLGGTEMADALGAVFALPRGAGHDGADVLLITDGEIWQADEMIAAARRSGHRVFAIGVGAAPAEGVLRALAESTGGACEFATPGEALEAAARRMLHRMRQPVYTNVRVDWGSVPAWSAGPGASLFGGDTVVALAGFARGAPSGTVRLLADDAAGQAVELARGEAEAPCAGDSLARLAAARRLAQRTEGDAVALALQYQLMTPRTHCILVHQRAEADQATGEAELHRVSGMLAAGWGGLGAVRAAPRAFLDADDVKLSVIGPEPVFARMCLADESPFECLFAAPVVDEPTPVTLEAIAVAMKLDLEQGSAVSGLAERRAGLPLHAEVRLALADAVQAGLGADEAWLLLAHWINTRDGGLANADLAALLAPWVQAIDPALAALAAAAWERHLGAGPTPSRQDRLARALGRVGS